MNVVNFPVCRSTDGRCWHGGPGLVERKTGLVDV